MAPDISGFYFITDANLTRQGAFRDAEDAIRGGARIVQYREKNKTFIDMLAEAKQIAELCRESEVIFIVNDSPELATAVGADGLHIGPHDLSPKEARKLFPKGILGVSCGTVRDVHGTEKAGADYVAASPVFFTSTKSDIGRTVGLEGIREFRKITGLPIVAIGGINLDNVSDVIAAGADAACAISATVATDSVEKSVRTFVGEIDSARKNRR